MNSSAIHDESETASLAMVTVPLLSWWEDNKRTFPWRITENPYDVLTAEVLLHRTQAKQVAPIYPLFLSHFPDVSALAEATLSDLLNILRPLGLTWRSRLLIELGRDIVYRFEGRIPAEKDELMSLPGVGQYISSAVRCFAFGFPDAILDTNTVRVASRVFGIPMTDASRRSKQYRSILERLVDVPRPRDLNWAMIDLASLVCKSRSPVHDRCPIRVSCKHYLKIKS